METSQVPAPKSKTNTFMFLCSGTLKGDFSVKDCSRSQSVFLSQLRFGQQTRRSGIFVFEE
jgi:hypothetical protein